MPYQEKDPHRTGIGARFPMGTTVLSDGVQAIVANDPVAAIALNTLLRFHQNGEWRSLSPEGAAANEQALVDGGEIVSSYSLQGRPVVIITDAAPRARTTVLLREEYDALAGSSD